MLSVVITLESTLTTLSPFTFVSRHSLPNFTEYFRIEKKYKIRKVFSIYAWRINVLLYLANGNDIILSFNYSLMHF